MSSLTRFGIDPSGDPKVVIPKMCALLEAILNNPDHLIGNSRSLIKFPSVKAALVAPIAGSSKAPLHGDVVEIPDSSGFGARFTVGFVYYQNAGATDSEEGVTGILTPEINGVPIDQSPELLELPATESWVYLRIKTTADGVPKFDTPPTIEAFDAVQKSVHHVRSSPSGGEEEGDYFSLLLKTGPDESDPPKPVIKKRVSGNKYLPNQLIEIANIGGAREWYQGYMPGPDDKHEIRSAKQLETRGVPIIEPLDPGSPAEDPVVDANGNVLVEGKPAVPPETQGPTIDWRTIAQRLESPQIKVTAKQAEEPDASGRKRSYIQVEGNDFDNLGTAGFVANYSCRDGLTTGLTDIPFGLDKEIRITDACGTLVHVLKFEKGILYEHSLEATVSVG